MSIRIKHANGEETTYGAAPSLSDLMYYQERGADTVDDVVRMQAENHEHFVKTGQPKKWPDKSKK